MMSERKKNVLPFQIKKKKKYNKIIKRIYKIDYNMNCYVAPEVKLK